MRNWLNDVRSYIEPVKLGEVMRSLGLGRVIKSNDGGFKEGDLVSDQEGFAVVAVLRLMG